jgi:insulysin
MILPKNEKRIFDSELLDNGIKVVYVEDSLTDKTIISVAVNVGSFANPKDFQGLAHFLEHMLFLGSKKYPDENTYEKAVKKFGGVSNAYTDHFHTIFYFSVFNNGIQEVTNIFSRFFIDPLFKEDAVNREINAVNSEHQKNINSDHWREYQLLKNISKKDSQHNTFPTGNIESLKKEGLRDKMIEFWKKYYITTNLSICIVSNIKINKQKTIINNAFGKIPKNNENIETFTLIKPIFEDYNKTYQMVPLSDIQQLNYYWEIPNDAKFRKNKLFIILGDLLVKANKNTYLNYLKINGFIQTINTNIHETEGIFGISFHLTKLGLKNLDLIDGTLKYELDIIFNYDWVKIIAYYKKIHKINFDNLHKINSLTLANKLSVNLHHYNFNEVFSGDFLITRDSDSIDLIKPYFYKSHMKILVATSTKLTNKIIDPHYGTEYTRIKNIESEIIKFNSRLDLNNSYLDMKPQLINNLDCDQPILIREKTWYGGSSKFNEAIIKGCLILESPKFFNSELNFLLTILSQSCLGFYLNQELFNILSLNFEIKLESYSKYNSIGIEYHCPNDPIKFNQFFNKTLNLIQTASIPSKIIESKIQNLREQLINVDQENPWQYSKFYHNVRIQSNEYLNTQLLSVLDKITERDIKLFINQIFDDCTLTIFFFGNLTADQIPQNEITNKFIFNPHFNFPKIIIPQDLTINHPNINEKNNCVTYYYYIGSFSPLKWLNLFITELILENKFYEELRTKKQMGYLVHLGINSNSDNYFLIEKIQSNRSCDEICIEINKFNDSILKLLEKCNLDEIKISAKNHLKEKYDSIDDYYNVFFKEIISRKYLFDRKKIILQQMNNITKDSIKEFVNEYIFNNQYKSIFKLKGNA